MIPLFPKFKKLELKDKKQIEKITLKYSAYSDFNFVSLWSYNTEDDIIISVLHDNLVIRFRDYITNERFYSFLGTNNVSLTIKALLLQAKKGGLLSYLKLIPEKNIISENNLYKQFHIQEDRDNFDYVLSIPEYITLKTSKYSHHRKLINRFYKNNPEYRLDILDLSDKKIKKELLNLFYLWEKGKNRRREETQHELIALERTLRDANHLNIISLGIYNKNQLLGIIIADLNHAEHVESHFLKYHPDYSGLNHLLHHFLAKQLSNKTQKYINIEQDLGIEGLRIAKESCKPVTYLKKYTISHKSTFN